MSSNKNLSNINNPALALLVKNPQDDTKYHTHEDILDQTVLEKHTYVKTQGRKGHKKPRINLAFDSDSLLSEIRLQAEKEGKSITQLVNESCSLYLSLINKNKK